VNVAAVKAASCSMANRCARQAARFIPRNRADGLREARRIADRNGNRRVRRVVGQMTDASADGRNSDEPGFEHYQRPRFVA
jgi:hypothetical protein